MQRIDCLFRAWSSWSYESNWLRFKSPDDFLSRDEIAIVVALSHPPSPFLWHYLKSRPATLERTLHTSVRNPRGPLQAGIESRKLHPHFVHAACRKPSAYPCSISALKLGVSIINHLRICVRACSIVEQSASHSLRKNSQISERCNFQSTSAEKMLIFFWRWRPSWQEVLALFADFSHCSSWKFTHQNR